MKLALRLVLICFPLVVAGCVDIEYYYEYPKNYAVSAAKLRGIPVTEKDKAWIEKVDMIHQNTTIRYKLNQTNKPSLMSLS